MHIRQLDVKNAFLNGNLSETIFMQKTEGFIDPNKPDHVCRLQKTLYGLKQAARSWYWTLKKALSQLGLVASCSDPSIMHGDLIGNKIWVVVYVDDLLLIYKSVRAVGRVQQVLEQSFLLKNLGPNSDYLGISVQYDRLNGSMRLSQQIAIERTLKRFQMQDCKPILTPMEKNSAALLRSKSPQLPTNIV